MRTRVPKNFSCIECETYQNISKVNKNNSRQNKFIFKNKNKMIAQFLFLGVVLVKFTCFQTTCFITEINDCWFIYMFITKQSTNNT